MLNFELVSQGVLSDSFSMGLLLSGHNCLSRQLYHGYQACGQRCLVRHPIKSYRLPQMEYKNTQNRGTCFSRSQACSVFVC